MSVTEDQPPAPEELSSAEELRKSERRGAGLLVVVGARVLIVVAALGLWQLLSGRVIPAYIISSPHAVASVFGSYVTSHAGWVDIRTTLEELLIAYFVGEVLGFIVGVVLGTVRTFGKIMEPLIAAANGVPHIALAPLFIIFLGIGIWSKVAIGAMIVFFVMFYNCYQGIRGINQELVSLIRLFGARRRTVLRYVIIPGMMPAVLSGLSAGIPFALIGVIVGEFIAAVAGVGNYIVGSSNRFDAAGTYAGICVLLIIVLIANVIFHIVQARALRWQGK